MKKKKIKCPSCGKNDAVIDKTYGVLPCDSCQEDDEQVRLKEYREFTSTSIRNERRERAASMLQPFHDGHLSKEYLETHGTDRIKVSKEDIRNAKEVYKGKIKRHHKIAESKK